MKQAHNDMRVKVKAQFLSPSTYRMLKVGDEMNVEKNRFWLKRLQQGDVEQVSAKTKAAPKASDQPAKSYQHKPTNKKK